MINTMGCYFTDGGCRSEECNCVCHQTLLKISELGTEFEKFRHEVFWKTAEGTMIGSGDDMAYVYRLFEWLMKHNNSNCIVINAWKLAKEKFGNKISGEAWDKLKAEAEDDTRTILDLYKKLDDQRREILKLREQLDLLPKN